VSYRLDEFAAVDIDAITEFYVHADRRTAVRFISDIFNSLALLQANPRMGQLVEGGCRRFILRRFPFALIYKTDEIEKQIVVIAVTHHSRHPGHWQSRIQEEPAEYLLAA
jgi:plasmid stabilization system protein ParE